MTAFPPTRRTQDADTAGKASFPLHSFRMVGRGIEKLLIADTNGPDRRLPVCRDQPVRKTMSGGEFGVGVLCRVQLNDVVSIDQMSVALDDDNERLLVLKA